MTTALEGIRVLELTHMVSGPYAGMLLADLGAETIKVEPPGRGEMTRPLMTDNPDLNIQGMGPYFTSLNRNKKSITIDLKHERGLELFYELVGLSDVVLCNYSVGVLGRLKIDHEHLAAINPLIITCSITGFGEIGPQKDAPSYDMVAQAMSGAMSITGHPESPPTRTGYPISDVSGSLMAVTGIMAALLARHKTGRGQHVDISMLDAQLSAMNYMAATALMTGENPERIGNSHTNHVPYNTYACEDGHIILAVVTDEFWKSLTGCISIEALNTPENERRSGRLKNRVEIDRVLGELFSTQPRSYWLERIAAARVPCAPVNHFMEAFDHPQVLARNMVVEVEHSNGQTAKMVGNAVKLSDTHGDAFTPAPQLGEHNEAVFGGLLKKSKGELEELANSKVI